MVGEGTAPAAFGRYVVLQRLGVGGMGAVYLARDESLGREVAVKVLRPLIAVGEPPADLVERFRREARAIALLSHPSIVRVYDQGVEAGAPYLVMELCDGATLGDRIKASGPLPVREVRTLGIQIASALAAAHAAGVVHRDVKPSNVLQAAEGSWKLADFGIARVADSSLTITGQFLGTPAYAAPEALQGQAPGAPGDVYSLAATLYAAMVGEPPFGDANLAQIAVALATRRAQPIAERRTDVPPSVSAAIERGLSRVPSERPAAAELAHMLAVGEQAAAPGVHAAPIPTPVATPTSIPTPTPVPVAPATPRSPRRAIAIAVVAALALVLVALALGDSGDAPPSPVAAPAVAASPSGAPPWETGRPPELSGGRHGKPSSAEKQWRKALEKLHEGEWRKADEELSKILARDPGNPTARAWVDWIRTHTPDEED
jgi:serine/threonine-protein kinase